MKIPIRRLHKPTGHDRCRFNGKEYWFGKHGSPDSDRRYSAWVAELLAGHPDPPSKPRPLVQVNDLTVAFLEMARRKYSGGEFHNLRQAARMLLKSHRETRVDDFGPRALLGVRTSMVLAGWPRQRINDQVNRIRRMFRWGVSQELVHVHTALALREMLPLRQGEAVCGLLPRESAPVRPADPSQVEQILPQLVPQLADMLRLHTIVGMRPGDLVKMRPGDVDQSDKQVWVYRPDSHKTAWRGKHLAYAIGPKAQEILKPYLNREFDEYCFQPAVTILQRREIRDAKRKTKRTKQAIERLSKNPPAVAECYTSNSYRLAIVRAAKRITKDDREAFLALYFAPNRLRHTKATELRASHGIEAARVALGHSNISTTLIYAEADLAKAKAIALESG
jgi:integrase